MSAYDSPASAIGYGITIPLTLRPRRSSLVSLTSTAPVDKEQLAQALDQIHTNASQSESLTIFNEFAPPPPRSANTEAKGLASDIVQNGLSGLYSRFRGAVGASRDRTSRGESESINSVSTTSLNTATPTSRSSAVLPKAERTPLTPSIPISTASSRLQSPTTSPFPAYDEGQFHSLQSPQPPLGSPATNTKPSSVPRPAAKAMSKPATSTPMVPVLAPINVNAFKDQEPSRVEASNVSTDMSLSSKLSQSTSPVDHSHNQALSVDMPPKDQAKEPSLPETLQTPGIKNNDKTLVTGLDSREAALRSALTGADGSVDEPDKPAIATKSAAAALRDATKLSIPDDTRRPAAIKRITQSHLPGYQGSRGSSTDRSTAEASPIDAAAHDNVRHASFSKSDVGSGMSRGRHHITGTTTNEGAPEIVSARLEQMRKQVLSKEFWMADEICRECFLCGDPFTAFRRKHHCRTCGCIFDSKCTSTISGQKFGVQGSLRVCRTCLDIINRRHDSSGSEESDEESALPTFFQIQHAKIQSARPSRANSSATQDKDEDGKRLLTTPMMAIPATRALGEANKRSAVLEIDAPHLSRPSSSRSLRALSITGRPSSSSHRRLQSRHNFFSKLKSSTEERAPFHRGGTDDSRKSSQLPAFHDDNIIDPDLAPYLSDEASSGEEQSIFSTITNASRDSPNFENDRSGFGALFNASRKHRSKNGDKSVSGLSFNSRVVEDNDGTPTLSAFPRPTRRRNLSVASNTHYQSRPSPLQLKHSNLAPDSAMYSPATEASSVLSSRMTRSVSMRDAKAPAIELNNASLVHVKRLLHQLLEDADIPNMAAWEKALIPILLQCTDDVDPNVRRGDDIDIRHYVKVKKIPGGRPGDTAYVSGIVFTKNVALKSMPRSISHPRIVIVSFPIEYQRHQMHFMSLEPVIAQEKEFLKNMVNRIASLRPSLLLVQKNISGLALQYLAEANIAVAYNVKQSVIEAVSRFAQTEIISSIDMVALKPVHIGRCAGFDVKTYVHTDIPGRKKTYVYLSGCPKDLGCTIALRGASMPVLTQMKRITEFMVYIVYNLKLETCLMRDEFVFTPSTSQTSGSMSPIKQTPELNESQTRDNTDAKDAFSEATEKLNTVAGSDGLALQLGQSTPSTPRKAGDSAPSSAVRTTEVAQASLSEQHESPTVPSEHKVISAHASHAHNHEDQLPDDVPMPTFYSDMVAKHQTKVLSASPFVKFQQPYLLMKAREQERRLTYLRRLRDQDTFEEQSEHEKSKPQKFQLIKPEMVHETVNRAPKQIMEILHAVHDAEFDKALHNYQTQKRQWENYIQGNLDLFDPFYHQSITVLYTVVCTETTIPCAGPELLTLAFYNEHESGPSFDSDCTLGQYVEDLCQGVDTICNSNSCDRQMFEHHRTYVHGEARVTVFSEKSPCKLKGLEDSILMWSYCKICKKETTVIPMSESTWKYSFGKYLELSFWSGPLRSRSGVCPHDQRHDHLRYFGFRDVAIRIHYDPIDLLEIIVPRSRVTWKVDNDLRLKNDQYTRIEERWNRFMASVNSRIKGINIDSVTPEKVEACKAEIEKLSKRAHDEHASELRKLQEKYMNSKYYEIVPMNGCVRSMQEKVAGWDEAFAGFDNNFFPSEKDIRRLAALQLRKMFMDRDESTSSLMTVDGSELTPDLDEKSPLPSANISKAPSVISVEEPQDVSSPVGVDNAIPMTSFAGLTQDLEDQSRDGGGSQPLGVDREDIQHLDLALPKDQIPEPSSDVNTPAEHSGSSSSADQGDPASKESSPEPTLSEKVERLRKASQGINKDLMGTSHPVPSSIPRPSERRVSRGGSGANSPPLVRTQSQPAVAPRRMHPMTSKSYGKQGDAQKVNEALPMPHDALKDLTHTAPKADKRLSERLGLGSLKVHRKNGHSLIPRSIHSKRKESKVSTLAKHFEQLSREFEKERLRDRKQRAAKVTQFRSAPKASSKPIVEVYKDVHEAVEERELHHAPSHAEPSQSDTEPATIVEGLAEMNQGATAGGAAPHSPEDNVLTADETATEAETDDFQPIHSQMNSDDEGDADDSLIDEMIPGIEDIAKTLKRQETDISMDLPKHEKTSLMKMLTNFWAERSASGWTSLEYMLNASDHIFVDSDIVVREDEPSSLIAFTLASEDYKTKLQSLRLQGGPAIQRQSDGPVSEKNSPTFSEDGVNQAEVETSLLRATGTHLAYSFAESSARMQCKIFFAEQFDAVRRKCGVSDRVVESLSRCLKWDSKGGKTKSVFLKTLDDRFILKSLSPIETQAFLKFAPAYFNIMAEALFHDLPTVIAKMLGFFQISIKNSMTGTEIKWDVLVMENLFYDRSPTRIFDLKGSMRNRKIQSTGEQNEVLLDENMVEFIYESPLFAREVSVIRDVVKVPG